jgi:hypothetical protein
VASFGGTSLLQRWPVAIPIKGSRFSNSLQIVRLTVVLTSFLDSKLALTSADLTTVLKSNALEYTANGELAVLIVDNFTLRVLTSCLTMDDILAAGYAGELLLVESDCYSCSFSA